MNNVITMNQYRGRKKREWLARRKVHLEKFLCEFIKSHIFVSFEDLAHTYVSSCSRNSEISWDYEDLREAIHECVTAPLGDEMYRLLNEQWWFDSRWVSKDEVLDTCLSLFIHQSYRKAY